MHRRLLYKWRDQLEPIDDGEAATGRTPASVNCGKQIAQLKRVVADKTLEADFFKGALQKVEARRQSNSELWRDGIYDQIRELMPMQGSLSIERMCQLARVSRAGFYRSLQEQRAGGRGHGSAVGDSADRRSNTGGAMATGGSRQNCGGAECW